MASPVSTTSTPQALAPAPAHKNACQICARRKVKCDRGDPCSNCRKGEVECTYGARVPHPPRVKKRPADEELLARLAAHEDLLKQHKIDFSSQTNFWVAPEVSAETGAAGLHTPMSLAAASPGQSRVYAPRKARGELQRSSWSTLSPELKYPFNHCLRHKDDPFLHPSPSLQSIFETASPELHKLHPDPRHSYRLWQIFVESVNPLTKIVHVPTLQLRILDASWNPASAPASLTAIMFAIYNIAITSISSEDCLATFGEIRAALLTRYRGATLRALVAAEFLTTKDLEVLQAFTLFLLSDPESDLTSTLCSAATKIARRMGIHREHPDRRISVFENEMRVRLWWQLYGLDSRTREFSHLDKKPPLYEFGDCHLPLNVNDSDLHPDMTEPPVEHTNPTEMMCVLVKLEVAHLVRSSPTTAKLFQSLAHRCLNEKLSMSVYMEDEAVNELERLFDERFFRRLDKRIPLHNLTAAMANLIIARLRFKLHHPRGRAGGTPGSEVLVTKEQADVLFEAALVSLEIVEISTNSQFSAHLFNSTQMVSKFLIDAYIYVISELRERCSGHRVAAAWKLVEDLFNRHPELIEDMENTFFAAFDDLTLEAWDARAKEIAFERGGSEFDIRPSFIKLLWDKRRSGNEQGLQMAGLPELQGGINFTDGNDFDWDYWNDFLRL